MTGHDPEAVVRAFIARWNAMDLEGVLALLHAEVVYHNVPMRPLHGKEAAETYLRAAWRFESVDWELVNIAVAQDGAV
ncbi:MAG: nuclear transport factor 2 family protein, partial [Caulobacterales bacterium]|nr:nuclear transport factor 2 family protein [Caulobacterales bacterium]